jgi:predicted nucleic acid-binding protein
MKRYLLDTSAILALRDDEAGADDVADILQRGLRRENRCMVCFITLMEVLYRVWKDEGEEAGRLAYEQCLALPLVIRHEDEELLQKAAELKAKYPLSLADAWIAAAAILEGAVLVHKDPEFEAVQSEQFKLPYRKPALPPDKR